MAIAGRELCGSPRYLNGRLTENSSFSTSVYGNRFESDFDLTGSDDRLRRLGLLLPQHHAEPRTQLPRSASMARTAKT